MCIRDRLLVDDFDTDEDTKNPDIIQKRWDWWENALYPLSLIHIFSIYPIVKSLYFTAPMPYMKFLFIVYKV